MKERLGHHVITVYYKNALFVGNRDPPPCTQRIMVKRHQIGHIRSLILPIQFLEKWRSPGPITFKYTKIEYLFKVVQVHAPITSPETHFHSNKSH